MNIIIIKQFFASIGVAVVSVLLELQLGADGIVNFLTQNGLILILALFGLNCGAGFQMLATFRRIEEKRNKGQFLDACRLSILRGMKEQLFLSISFYILLLVSSSSYLTEPTSCYAFVSVANFTLAVLIRACLFQIAYCTYDHSKTAIESNLDPKNLPD